MSIRSRLLTSTLVVTLLAGVLPTVPAQAAMIDTQTAFAWQDGQEVKAGLRNLLQREEVRQALLERGVAADQVTARVAALSDDEARQLGKRIDSLPAGGDGILGVVFAVFIILLVTDILGLTKVFPFTRSINRR